MSRGRADEHVEMGLGAVLKGMVSASHHAANDMLEQPISALGLSLGEADLLSLILISRNEQAAPTDLARLLGLTTAGTTGRLNALAKRELVERRSHPHDGRRLIVHLTSEGRQLAQQVLDIKNDLLTEIVAEDLGPERARRLVDDLDALLEATRRRTAGP